MVYGDEVPRCYRVIDPRNGAIVSEGLRPAGDGVIPDDNGQARVFICYDEL